jgi:hypothetical protein
MKEKHIIEILDNGSISSLSEIELNEVRDHARECESCRGAYEAARVSMLVIRSRAASAIEPSPFFQTRVMAALREQQAVESVPAILRLWNSARALVSSMAVTTAALAVLSFFIAAPATPAPEQTASLFSADSVIMDQAGEEQMSYEQVLSTIYDEDEAR